MKLRKIIYTVAISAITLLSISSCQLVDVLDKRPPYDADLDGAITNAKTAELALIGVYSKLPQYSGNWYFQVAQSFSTGLMRKPTWWTAGNAVYHYERNWPTLGVSSDGEWDSAYNIIKNANFLLSKLDEINDFSEGRREEMRGELHFLKGFSYHRLIIRYAEHWDLNSKLGVIIREELPAIGLDKKSRSSVQESYDIAINNLDVAINSAPKYDDSGYASSIAAKAIKAKLLMDMGKYSEAAELASEVIAKTELEGTYADVFTKASSSKEILFARKISGVEVSNMSTRESAINDAKWGITQSYIDIIGDDPRASVIYGDSVMVDYRGTVSEDYMSAPVKKLSNAANDLPIIYLRAAEMYLIRAEALMRSGASIADSYAPIADLRRRAGAEVVIPSTPDDLEDAILNEWLIELGCENGSEWLAIRRVGIEKLLEVNDLLNTAYEEQLEEAKAAYINRIGDRRIFAIPSSEINSNPVTQNPGY